MRRSSWSLLACSVALVVAAPLNLRAQVDTLPSGSTLVPIPAVFYQPETGTGFGAVVGYFFTLGDPLGGLAPTSSLGVSAIYTTKKQVLTGVQVELFPDIARYWIRGNLEYQLFPTKFWGIGSETPNSAEEDYTPRFVRLSLDVQRRVARGWYAGVALVARHRSLPVAAEGGMLESGAIRGSETVDVVGAGVMVTADSRDRVLAPRRGALHSLRILTHPAGVGNEYGFTQFTVDLRGYLPLAPGHVLAVRGLGMATAGHPAFDNLPELGGDVLLRGYYQGRFRDRQLVALEADYRFPLAWIVRGVAFAGAGAVADRITDFTFGRFKTNAGAGLRFVLDREEGLSIRMDYAWGFDANSSGLYFGIGEAF